MTQTGLQYKKTIITPRRKDPKEKINRTLKNADLCFGIYK